MDLFLIRFSIARSLSPSAHLYLNKYLRIQQAIHGWINWKWWLENVLHLCMYLIFIRLAKFDTSMKLHKYYWNVRHIFKLYINCNWMLNRNSSIVVNCIASLANCSKKYEHSGEKTRVFSHVKLFAWTS